MPSAPPDHSQRHHRGKPYQSAQHSPPGDPSWVRRLRFAFPPLPLLPSLAVSPTAPTASLPFSRWLRPQCPPALPLIPTPLAPLLSLGTSPHEYDVYKPQAPMQIVPSQAPTCAATVSPNDTTSPAEVTPTASASPLPIDGLNDEAHPPQGEAVSVKAETDVRVQVKLEVAPFYSPPLPPSSTAKASASAKPAIVVRGKSEQATFLSKLYNLLSTPEYQHIICWSDDGTVIRIEDPPELARHILPIVYKQSKFASFSRQLNIYGFMRKTSLRHTTDGVHHRDASTWAHDFLNRDSTAEDLQGVKRRVQVRPDFPLPAGRQRRSAFARRVSPLPIPALPLSTSSGTPVSSDGADSEDEGSDAEPDAWLPLFADETCLQARKVRSKAPGPIALPPPSTYGKTALGTLGATVPLPLPSPLTPVVAHGSMSGPFGQVTGSFPWYQTPVPGTGAISPALLHSPGMPMPYSQPSTNVNWQPAPMPWSNISSGIISPSFGTVGAQMTSVNPGLFQATSSVALGTAWMQPEQYGRGLGLGLALPSQGDSGGFSNPHSSLARAGTAFPTSAAWLAPNRFVLETPPPGEMALPDVAVEGDDMDANEGSAMANFTGLGVLGECELVKGNEEQIGAEFSWTGSGPSWD